ncbi:HD-GYP domain, c-di-GMP phosphodiesterase class II (or its inactivated variant) [Streptomyces sp. WMMB 714]|uniref:HD-GYP domain-containing protein n=1 Tax=Streptomyces sp. WMMB 714 TaxID=1286822 RepID=UPI0005F7E877|nr:HD domain-containing protein [Streptomyces sp. WMMB 714]SCK12471.1 HD-GYP domain, c-di-GMP phosphodiesterase class II (or its inactivated variant) [Streptomyces sp. WMMB 714]
MRYAAVLCRAAAAALVLAALGVTLWRGLQEPYVALAFGSIIAVGEVLRVRLPDSVHDGVVRSSAPLGAAGALGYALLGDVAGRPAGSGVLQCVAVMIIATLAGLVPRAAKGATITPDHAARGVLTVGFAATCFQPLYSTGALGEWVGEGPYYALWLLAVTLLTGLCDAVLAAMFAAERTGWPLGALLRGQLRARVGIGPAIAATGAVIALAVSVGGLWALPVFCVPLLLTQFSFRRYSSVRETYRQTIASLARATEVAGYTPHGHARRVAALSCAVGRELGLIEPDLTVLEYAALMHDIGQLSLVDPVEDGATAHLDTDLQRRIALLGGAVVRQTGVASEVAVVVERQADPFRDQPLTARIVRTVNAYEDMVAGKADMESSLRALERLRLGGAHDYESRVVEALSRVVARGPEA